MIYLLPLLLLAHWPAIAICEARYGVPQALVYAIIQVESGGDTMETSPSGMHHGLMQMGQAWARVPAWALHVPAVGIVEGCNHLSGWRAVPCDRRWQRYKRDWPARLALYVIRGWDQSSGPLPLGLRRVPGTQRQAPAHLSGVGAWRCALVGYRRGWKAAMEAR